MYFKNYLTQAQGIKKKSSEMIISESTKGAMTAAMVGAGVGLYVGYTREYNLLMSGFIGSLIGVVIAKAFIK